MSLDAFIGSCTLFFHFCIHDGEFCHFLLDGLDQVGDLQFTQFQFMGRLLLLIDELGLRHLEKSDGILLTDFDGDVFHLSPDSLFVSFCADLVGPKPLLCPNELARERLLGEQPSDGSTDSEASEEESVFKERCHACTITTTVYDESPDINVQIMLVPRRHHAF